MAEFLLIHFYLNQNFLCVLKVNIKSAGPGELNCYAYYSDGEQAEMDSHQIDQFLYSYRIAVDKKKTGLLNLYLEHVETE